MAVRLSTRRYSLSVRDTSSSIFKTLLSGESATTPVGSEVRSAGVGQRVGNPVRSVVDRVARMKSAGLLFVAWLDKDNPSVAVGTRCRRRQTDVVRRRRRGCRAGISPASESYRCGTGGRTAPQSRTR
jgi:hypothetical protein